jgi:hypothetical protein
LLVFPLMRENESCLAGIKDCQCSIEGIDPQVGHAVAGGADRFQVF